MFKNCTPDPLSEHGMCVTCTYTSKLNRIPLSPLQDIYINCKWTVHVLKVNMNCNSTHHDLYLTRHVYQIYITCTHVSTVCAPAKRRRKHTHFQLRAVPLFVNIRQCYFEGLRMINIIVFLLDLKGKYTNFNIRKESCVDLCVLQWDLKIHDETYSTSI